MENIVFANASHGGFDGGAVAGDGTVEKDINLNISLTLAKFLKQNGFRVIMTREADVSTEDTESPQIASKKKNDLKNRLKLMSDYPDAVFVSIHLNKFTTSSAFGPQVFYSKSDESAVLADKIQKAIVSLIQPDNTRVNKQATSSTYLLYNATVPAVLVECGFLSNASELALLKQPDYQNKMAFSIYTGILEYFKEKDNGSEF
ncbi:MAG: N-acetylmuramoyl-L-alanine amidase [Clostridia bacterium]|nr:N-acetylmuramoyl-L-alanine amidase [Clostridia bacterium]